MLGSVGQHYRRILATKRGLLTEQPDADVSPCSSILLRSSI